MSTPTTDRRHNGFSRPFSGAQLAAWAAFLFSLIEFLFFVSPIMPIAISIPVTLVFLALFTGTAYYGVIAQTADPMDLHLSKHLYEDGNDPYMKRRLYRHCNPQRPIPNDEPLKQCWICDTQVAEHSMHCKFCNKCVGHFDHHCKWLNTCVGEANYKSFFRTMICLFLMELVHFIVQIGLVVDYGLDGKTLDRSREWFDANAAGGVHAIIIFFICFNAVSIFMVGQLLWFHIGLQRDNLTTYQYIVRDHQKRREQSHLEEILEAQRTSALAKARQDGQSMYVLELTVGAWCRKVGCDAFDPLVLPEPEPEPDVENEGFGVALGRQHIHQQDSYNNNGAAAGDDDSEVGKREAALSVKKHSHRYHHHNNHHDEPSLNEPSISSTAPNVDLRIMREDTSTSYDADKLPISPRSHKHSTSPKHSKSPRRTQKRLSYTSSKSPKKHDHERSKSLGSRDTSTIFSAVTALSGTDTLGSMTTPPLRASHKKPPQSQSSVTSEVTTDTANAVLPVPKFYSARGFSVSDETTITTDVDVVR